MAPQGLAAQPTPRARAAARRCRSAVVSGPGRRRTRSVRCAALTPRRGRFFVYRSRGAHCAESLRLCDVYAVTLYQLKGLNSVSRPRPHRPLVPQVEVQVPKQERQEEQETQDSLGIIKE